MTDDRGTGLVGTLGGVAMFGVLLMVAVNLLAHLHATSTVTAVAFDAARTVAHAPAGDGARIAAVATARGLLGEAGGDTTFDWSGSNRDVVRLRVDAPGPHVLPRPLLRRLRLDRVRKSVIVRAERFEDAS